jgi:hypothetical protein
VVQPAPSTNGGGGDSLHIFEQAMREAGIDEATISQVAGGLRKASTRGRDGAGVAARVQRRTPEEAPISIMTCRDCGEELRAHYDKSNRFRGCAYATAHGTLSE